MKNRVTPIGIAIVFFLAGDLGANENIPVGWMDGEGVRLEGNIAFIETNKGITGLKVIEYDAENDRYLVECICTDGEHYYPKPEKLTP